ncbi:dihydroxyacetone kinase subunit DhaL [Kitasatospora sp. NPDC088346]|uniref:dihydroxyacetone kinase subunit DhaL n=1 Tax=Kitasatospora sp. NPDC088346 TaxID=3364073 RepID=UPI0037F49BBB
MDTFDTEAAAAWLRAAAHAVERHESELTALDTAIGDGDHGSNLRRGFTAVGPPATGPAPSGPGELLRTAGRTLISTVGGASGPLYGTAFRAIGAALPGPTATAGDLAGALEAALAAVQELGGARPGDKTMVDALAPAAAAFRTAADQGRGLPAAAEVAARAAEQGMHDTVPLQARKGRASYLGPRSVGHQDPGATSTALVLRALAEVVAAP